MSGGSQLSCGELRRVTDQNSSIKFVGIIRLHGCVAGRLQLIDHPRAKPGESSNPNYEVFIEEGNEVFAIGAAWLKNSEKVNGGDFLSITLDSPKLDDPVNLSAFPPEDNKAPWRIVWMRPRQQQKAA